MMMTEEYLDEKYEELYSMFACSGEYPTDAMIHEQVMEVLNNRHYYPEYF